MTASTSLAQLAELLRRAEAKTRVQELAQQTEQAAELLRAAEERIRLAELAARDVRPARLRDLEQLDHDEQLFRELIRKTALNRPLLATDDQSEADRLIDASREDLRRRREVAQAELDSVTHELDEARRTVRAALEQYQILRQELDRLKLVDDERVAEVDRLAHLAETYFPEYQVKAFAREVDDSAVPFSMLERREQYWQLRIWLGRLRRFQQADLPDEGRDVLESVFRRLVSFSKQYEPGYIEAFNRQYTADWDQYVAEAQQGLANSSEESRRNRGLQEKQAEAPPLTAEQRAAARKVAETRLKDLKLFLLGHQVSTDPADIELFREHVRLVQEGYGTIDDALLDVVRPFRDYLGGPEFRTLRRAIDQVDEDVNRRRATESARDEFDDLIAATQGQRALMIGGAVREDARKLLLRTFEFEELEWVAYQDHKPSILKALEERIGNGSFDMVILLVSYLGNSALNRMLNACKTADLPCAEVDNGYGAVAVAEALRKVLDEEIEEDDDEMEIEDDDED